MDQATANRLIESAERDLQIMFDEREGFDRDLVLVAAIADIIAGTKENELLANLSNQDWSRGELHRVWEAFEALETRLEELIPEGRQHDYRRFRSGRRNSGSRDAY